MHKVENLHQFLTECPAFRIQRKTFITILADIDEMNLYYTLDTLKVVQLKCLIEFLKHAALVVSTL